MISSLKGTNKIMALLEDYEAISNKTESPVRIGHIAFCVLAAIPTWILLASFH
jgi:hypothetical protein